MQAPAWSHGAEEAEDAELQAALAASLQEQGGPAEAASDQPRGPAATSGLLPSDGDPLAGAAPLPGFPLLPGGLRRRTPGALQPGGYSAARPRAAFPPHVRDVPIEWRGQEASHSPAPGGLRIEEVDADQAEEEAQPPRQRVVVNLDSDDEEAEGDAEGGAQQEGSAAQYVGQGRGRPVGVTGPTEGPVTWQTAWGGGGGGEGEGEDTAAAAAAEEASTRGAGPAPMWAPGGGARWQVEDEDPELQAALAMSLKSAEEEAMVRRALAGDAGAAEALEAGGAQHEGPSPVAEHGAPDTSARGGAGEGGGAGAMPHSLTSGFESAGHEPVLGKPRAGAGGRDGDEQGAMGGSGAGEARRLANEAAAREHSVSADCAPSGIPEAAHRVPQPELPGNGAAAGPHEDLGGITEEEREMAAMYEAALFGVPYAPPEGPAAAPSAALPHPSSMAFQQHQELLRQWESMQQRHAGAEGGAAGVAGGQLGGRTVPLGAGVPDVLRGRPLLQPRRRRGGRGREGLGDPMDEDEEEENWEEEEEERRWRRGPREPDAKTLEQRFIREQQDDEYQLSLRADMEKEERARREAEEARLQEEEERALRAAEEESRKQAEEAYEARLRDKGNAIPPEPEASDPGAITILVRTPDGTRRSRRFLRSELFQTLLDFIETERICREGTYQLVRQFPNRVFSPAEDGHSSFEGLGLASKQEALFIRLL